MKKKENILINGCSKGIGLDFFNYLSLSYNVFGLSSVKSKKKNILYYNPFNDPVLTNENTNKLKELKIDHVIHCSGGGFKYYDKFLSLKKLKELFNVNFFSIYEINKSLIKNKPKNKRLNIIMIGSIAAFENKASIGYSITKSSLLNYNKNLSFNFKDENVISKLLIPGSFNSSKGSMSRLKKDKREIYKKIEKLMPNSKLQSSKNIIKFTDFLLSKESDLINGSYISLANLESKSIFL